MRVSERGRAPGLAVVTLLVSLGCACEDQNAHGRGVRGVRTTTPGTELPSAPALASIAPGEGEEHGNGLGGELPELDPRAQNCRPYVAASGVGFYTGRVFPPQYHGALLVAGSGSSSRGKRRGQRAMAHVPGLALGVGTGLETRG